jgi:hypothetical protein
MYLGEDDRCRQDLFCTDPRLDKTRIQESKGGLLEDSYRWILDSPDFQQWRNDTQSRLLWIKGDPGKGKTMLLCGIIDELSKLVAPTTHLCYFFCQATDSRINSATAVLRGILFMLVNQQPQLVLHIQKTYKTQGKALFESVNSWFALCETFTAILQDPSLDSAYFFVDALDECVMDIDKLLEFIVATSSTSSTLSRVKWIVTSRGLVNIEGKLRPDSSRTRLSLELKENAAQVSRAVDAYIDYRLRELEDIQHNPPLQLLLRNEMRQKANSTFLWVSLVMKELKDAKSWEVRQVLEDIPTELTAVYQRMMDHIKRLERKNPELCRQTLATVVAAYRPLHLQELFALADLPSEGPNVEETAATIVKMCGSFLTLREHHVYVIHQSARDFLSTEAVCQTIFPSGEEEFHKAVFSRSLQCMSTTLRRDMYDLRGPGCSAKEIQQPDPDPLAALRYSCVCWVDHLKRSGRSIEDGDDTHRFLKTHLLHWLEAMSLISETGLCVRLVARLQALATVGHP